MKDESLKSYNDIMDKILTILNDNDVSLEDGFTIATNLFLMTFHQLDDTNRESVFDTVINELMSSVGESERDIIPFNRIGLNRGWGLDLSLILEDH